MDGLVPFGFRTAKLKESRVQEALQDFRRVLVVYNLGIDSVLPRQPWTGHDADRLRMYPTQEAWPKVLGTVHTDPYLFRVIGEDQAAAQRMHSGPLAFTSRLSANVVMRGYATLLFLDGIDSESSVVAKNYSSLICRSEMAGNVVFEDYATAFVKGDVSGQVTSKSYFNMVVEGNFSGLLALEDYAMVYLLGGFEGEISLHYSRVYIAGRTTKADLGRIRGTGELYLEESDLPAGEHTVGDFLVTVAKNS
jgi:hypothetical protein